MKTNVININGVDVELEGTPSDNSVTTPKVADKAITKEKLADALRDEIDGKYVKPLSGIPKSDLAEEVKESLGKADSALQEHQSLAEYRKASQQDAIDAAIKNRATAIEEKIPSQASPANQLADKSFVNSSIGTNTANYISDNGEPFTDVSDLPTSGVTNNDYAFVTGTDEQGNVYYDRYKATVSGSTVTWGKEYRLNNSSFTAAQWAAINSGITSGLVEKLADLPTNAALVQLLAGKADVDDVPTLLSQLNPDEMHRTVTDEQITTWNAKYKKPSSGIPKSDLAEEVKGSLGKADSALQEHQSLAEYRKASQQDTIDAKKVDSEGSELAALAIIINQQNARIEALENALRFGLKTLVVDNLEVRNKFNQFVSEGNSYLRGAGAPSADVTPENWNEDEYGPWTGVPQYIGQRYLNTSTNKWYTAKGNAAVSDWVQDTNA